MEAGASIINTASIQQDQPSPTLLPYAATKAAIVDLTAGDDTPLGRAGQPAEVAPAYVLLTSDEASYMSGARIAVTGGKPIIWAADGCGRPDLLRCAGPGRATEKDRPCPQPPPPRPSSVHPCLASTGCSPPKPSS